MARFNSPLDHVKIAAPCTADWDRMFAFENKRVRFCSQCQLNVYNLSEMTRSEAEALLHYTEGRLCVRFYRRADGTILTQDCPTGLRAIKQRLAWTGQFILGMALSLLACIGLSRLVDSFRPRLVSTTGVVITPYREDEMKPVPLMGDVIGQMPVPAGKEVPKKKVRRPSRD